MGRHHPGQSWGQFGTERDLAFAFVGEIEELGDDLGTAFFLVKLGRFENRSVPFDESVAAADFAPARENHVPGGAIFWKEISKAGKWLHGRLLGEELTDVCN